jgi:transposase
MQVTTIGLDLAKNVFQVHGIAGNGDVAFNRALRRSQMLPFFARLAPCLVGIEACGTSHHWARELIKLGHTRTHAGWTKRNLPVVVPMSASGKCDIWGHPI